MLQYPVYVRSISNLSDARYCAGMGVELLGFCFDESNGISISEFEAIKGWLSGVKIVAEFYTSNLDFIKQTIDNIKPDFVHISVENTNWEDEISVPIIYDFNIDNKIPIFPKLGSLVVLSCSNDGKNIFDNHLLIKELVFDNQYKLFFGYGITAENIKTHISTYKAFGIALKGGTEIAPGLKSFDELADILEAIEV